MFPLKSKVKKSDEPDNVKISESMSSISIIKSKTESSIIVWSSINPIVGASFTFITDTKKDWLTGPDNPSSRVIVKLSWPYQSKSSVEKLISERELPEPPLIISLNILGLDSSGVISNDMSMKLNGVSFKNESESISDINIVIFVLLPSLKLIFW